MGRKSAIDLAIDEIDNINMIKKEDIDRDAFEEQFFYIKKLCDKQDVFCEMPTGSGKSLCFQYAAVKMPGVTIVIAPLNALMVDQVENFNKKDIKYKNESIKAYRFDVSKIRQCKKKENKIIYISPENIMNPKFLMFLTNIQSDRSISMIVVDEAHCISLWGGDFRTDFRLIPSFIEWVAVGNRMNSRKNSRPVIAAFSASATDIIRNDIVTLLGMKKIPREKKAWSFGRDKLKLSFIMKGERDKKKFLKTYIKEFINKNSELQDEQKKTGIIYCNRIKGAGGVESLYSYLREDDIIGKHIIKYYGKMSPQEKKRALNSFKENKIAISTNALGMGIDLNNIGFIIHYNPPTSIEDYYQEIGRAGRNSKKEISECVVLYNKSDLEKNVFVVRKNFEDKKTKNNYISLCRVYQMNGIIEQCKTEDENQSNQIKKEIEDYFQNSSIKNKEIFERDAADAEELVASTVGEDIAEDENLTDILEDEGIPDLMGNNYIFSLQKDVDIKGISVENKFFLRMVRDAYNTISILRNTPMCYNAEKKADEFSKKICKLLTGDEKCRYTKGSKLDGEIKKSLKVIQGDVKRGIEEKGYYTLIPTNMLYMKTMNNSIQSLALRYYLALRVLRYKHGKRINRIIRYEYLDDTQKGIFSELREEFGIKLGEDHNRDAYGKGVSGNSELNRLKKGIIKDVETIFDYYKEKGIIKDYNRIFKLEDTDKVQKGERERVLYEFLKGDNNEEHIYKYKVKNHFEEMYKVKEKKLYYLNENNEWIKCNGISRLKNVGIEFTL